MRTYRIWFMQLRRNLVHQALLGIVSCTVWPFFTSHIVLKPQRVLPSHKSTFSNIFLNKHMSINQLRTSSYMTVLHCNVMCFAQCWPCKFLKRLSFFGCLCKAIVMFIYQQPTCILGLCLSFNRHQNSGTSSASYRFLSNTRNKLMN